MTRAFTAAMTALLVSLAIGGCQDELPVKATTFWTTAPQTDE